MALTRAANSANANCVYAVGLEGVNVYAAGRQRVIISVSASRVLARLLPARERGTLTCM
jgi:hypothetical protein